MKTYLTTLIVASALAMTACGGGGQTATTSSTASEAPKAQEADPKGIGEIKQVTLADPPEAVMVSAGKGIYEMKCAACHRLNDQRLVGPGFLGVTNRRRPEWIMNMVTNVEVMLDKDPQAQKLLEECLTRMPNQNVSVGDARNILEFMRQNDLTNAGSKDQALNL